VTGKPSAQLSHVTGKRQHLVRHTSLRPSCLSSFVISGRSFLMIIWSVLGKRTSNQACASTPERFEFELRGSESGLSEPSPSRRTGQRTIASTTGH